MPRSRKKGRKNKNGLLIGYEYPSIYSEEFFSEIGTTGKAVKSSRKKGGKKRSG